MKLFLILLILIIIGIIFFINFKPVSGYYRGPRSDHFDGKIFFNPGHEAKKKSIIDLFRWWTSRKREKWPEQVKNNSYPPPAIVSSPGIIKITFINHASFLIQTQQLNFLTDPVWSERASPLSWLGPKRVRSPGIAMEQLPKIDVVMISHNHYDHLDLATLIKLNQLFQPIFIVPLGNKVFLNNNGIDKVIELDWWQSHSILNATISLLPTLHWSARWFNDRYFTLWGSYGITIENKKIYFAGDTGFSDHFKKIAARFGNPDIALLPIGSFLPRWFMKSNHLDPAEAVQAHLDLQAKHSIAMHFNTFQLSDEGIEEPVIQLKKALGEHKIKDQTFLILDEGESKEF